MHTLYINPLHTNIQCLILEDGKVVDHVEVVKNLDTAKVFPPELIRLVDAHHIEEIWCITGPGPFTLMRIITLSINALAMTRKLQLRGIHFFDSIQTGNTPLIEANPRECIIRTTDGDQTLQWEDIPPGRYEGISQTKGFTGGQDFIQWSEHGEEIWNIFSQYPSVPRLAPIYFKAPNITCSKPNTSPSSVLESNS